MGCLFPGARNPRELWQRLLDGHCALSDVPAARWSADVYRERGSAAPWRTCAARGGFLDSFTPDWRRYKMPPNLVDGSDPLQFMLLEAALDALEDARVDLDVVDRRRIAVVVGSGFGSDFALALTLALRVPEAAEAVADALRERGLPAGQVAAVVEELEGLLRARLPHVSEDSSGSFSSARWLPGCRRPWTFRAPPSRSTRPAPRRWPRSRLRSRRCAKATATSCSARVGTARCACSASRP